MRRHERSVDSTSSRPSAAAVRRPAAAREPARSGSLPPAPIGPSELAALQRAAGNAAVGAWLEEGEAESPDAVLEQAGRPLDHGLRLAMEASFGADFSTVRVHDDGSAAASARALGARAYTVGEDIVVGEGGSGEGTMAHELAHVVQQRSGPVAGTPTGVGFSVSDPGDPFERAAEATADAIVRGAGHGRQGPASVPERGAATAGTAQRETLSDAGGGQAPGAQPAPNPIVAALWEYAVQRPLHTAANALSDEKPDHRAAYEALKQASDGLDAAMAPLPSGDPRLPKANYLVDDIRLIRLWLAPRANVQVGGTDEEAAAKVGGMEYDAQVVGESLGGNPAPRQEVNPAIESPK